MYTTVGEYYIYILVIWNKARCTTVGVNYLYISDIEQSEVYYRWCVLSILPFCPPLLYVFYPMSFRLYHELHDSL